MRRGGDSKGPWRCSNCPKEFSQKEYRHKHQQRCIRASQRRTLTKQKSCMACAASKLGCDQATPSCSRCLGRNKLCEYVSSPAESSMRRPEVQPLETSDASLDDWTRLAQPDNVPLPPPSEDMYGNGGMSQEWFQQKEAMLSSGESGWQRDGSWVSESPFASPEVYVSSGNDIPSVPEEAFNFDLLGSLGILTQHPIDPGLATQHPFFAPALHTAATASTLITNNPPQSHHVEAEPNPNETLRDAVEAATGPSPSPPSPPWQTQANKGPFTSLGTNHDLALVIRSYPGLMVRPGTYPPFVHHKLYRCSTGDVAEPLARAFVCIGAFYSSVPTSEAFVHSLMNEESGKLVKGFHRSPSSDGHVLAVVHAMCVYQILGFFASDDSEQTRSAELQHQFFLKMTRQLIRQCLQTTTDCTSTNWRQWIMDETVRRTVFLVNAINTLSCRVQKQDPYYFEPLDDSLVWHMRMPAPEALWKASTVEEWVAAKAQIGPEALARSEMTMQQFRDQLRDGGDENIQPDLLDDFTRLISSTLEK